MDANTLPKPFYSDDRCTIYHGDCREILPLLGRFDLLLTDPPYGIGVDRSMEKASGTQYGKAKAAKRHYIATGWDDKTDQATVHEAVLTCTNAIVFGGNYYSLAPSSCWLVWDKEINGEFADCELAWTNFKKPVRKFKWRWNGMLQEKAGAKKEVRVHPTQKPVPLMQWCIGIAGDEVKTILDPYCGSGTTLVAAKLEGRHAVGIEINERYCELAAERLRQGVLF